MVPGSTEYRRTFYPEWTSILGMIWGDEWWHVMPCDDMDTCIPGIHVSQGYMYPGGYMYPQGYMYPRGWENIVGLWQVWKVPISNVNSKKSWFFWLFNSFQICYVKKLNLFIKNSVFEYSTPSKLRFLNFKTSISRNHAYRVLHSRFPPFGFVLKPFWSIHMILRQLWRTSGRPRPCMTADLCLAGLTQIPFEKKQFWSQKSILKGVPLSGQCPP